MIHPAMLLDEQKNLLLSNIYASVIWRLAGCKPESERAADRQTAMADIVSDEACGDMT